MLSTAGRPAAAARPSCARCGVTPACTQLSQPHCAACDTTAWDWAGRAHEGGRRQEVGGRSPRRCAPRVQRHGKSAEVYISPAPQRRVPHAHLVDSSPLSCSPVVHARLHREPHFAPDAQLTGTRRGTAPPTSRHSCAARRGGARWIVSRPAAGGSSRGCAAERVGARLDTGEDFGGCCHLWHAADLVVVRVEFAGGEVEVVLAEDVLGPLVVHDVYQLSTPVQVRDEDSVVGPHGQSQRTHPHRPAASGPSK